ncbi:30S ribosomal protein S1 [Parvularcula bermudensis HTCC2503]|uniref:30S ribosomal protein S1 n=1 Tax=Parvularcula bermudensis (strain ATCC BAA-594 / HTCC2503 / KCTC 12087) TaxID=314260 RepID=E0TBS4_PARBH|nr:SGNH/GDSL hydrolase family protein [Parvularcula bermudensis]ADM08417.1 30S ribosomal protein S1 [Parvularcula bermudensis HTCC2503]
MSPLPSFGKIVFFGDSLTDNGIQSNYREATDVPLQIQSELVYSEGRFSDGYNYADYFAYELGLTDELGIDTKSLDELTNGVAGGSAENFGVTASRASIDRSWQQLAQEAASVEIDPTNPYADDRVDLPGQVAWFLDTLEPGQDLSNVAVSMLTGINDLGNELTRNIIPGMGNITRAEAEQVGQDFAVEVFDSIVDQVSILADLGVGTVFLYTIPKVSETLLGSLASANGKAANSAGVDFYNELLFQSEDALETSLGINIEVFDVALFQQELTADYTTFGFYTGIIPVTLFGDAINKPVRGVPLDQIAFVDPIHPSEAAQKILVQTMLETLTAENIVGTLGRDDLVGTDGDDFVVAREGRDFVDLGLGDDMVLGGTGNDEILGGGGNDLISGGSGTDSLYGDDGNDVLVDNDGWDVVRGGLGNDILIKGSGFDTMFGDEGDDIFIYTDQDLFARRSIFERLLAFGGEGNDTLVLRLSSEKADAYNEGTLTLQDLKISIEDIENVVVVDGFDLPDGLSDNPLLAEAEAWNFV